MADYNNSNQKGSMPPIPKNALNEWKLRLTGPMQEGARRPPTLSVGVIKNQVRLDVFTNVPNDRDGGKLSAPMDSITFFAFLTKLEDVINGEPANKVEIVNRTGKPGSTRILSYTVIGKDNEGCVFISVTAQDRPRVKFTFLPTEYHSIVHKDGSPYSPAELSMVYARAWHRMMSTLVPAVLNTHYVEPEPRNDSGGGNRYGKGGGYNKGGYNKGGYSGGNNNSSGESSSGGGSSGPTDFDDDFPM